MKMLRYKTKNIKRKIRCCLRQKNSKISKTLEWGQYGHIVRMDLVYINLLCFFYSHTIVENLIRRYEVLSVICKIHGTGEVRPIEHIEEKKMF